MTTPADPPADESHTAPPDAAPEPANTDETVAEPEASAAPPETDADPQPETSAAMGPAADGDDDIIDAEIVPTPTLTAPSPAAPAFDYTDAGVPTLGYLQDKIDRRYGTAIGSTELAGATTEAQDAERRQAEREKAAADKLAEIRRSLHPDG